MKISLNWLRDLVAWDDDPAGLAARLTSAGLNVEGIEDYALSWPGVVVARVVACGKHPGADRLSLCKVDDGSGGEPHQVVCGAPNVREGLLVAFAPVGTVLPGDLKLKKAKIRGVESFGMICSADELALNTDHDGIMELEGDPALGTPLDDLFGYRDTVLDIEVTPNRPDWLSHLGVAREVAALYGTKLTPPPVVKPPANAEHGWKVEIENFADCPRYTAHGARNLKVQPSPDWMQHRLRAIGQRPINNVVDITNYVLMELGQPLHAFDAERLAGDTVVRRAGREQTVTTLDDELRQILADDLVIADGDGPVAVAGVMGMANSEVGPGTTSLLLESAFFAPQLIRTTSRRLNLVSESSYRFEREADWDMVRLAARRALYLFQEYADAQITGDSIDRTDPDRQQAADLALRVHQVNRVLGTKLDLEAASDYLRALGLTVQPLSPQVESKTVNLMVKVPSFRRDLKQEVDLVEEIARMHGFEFEGRRGRAAVIHAPVRSRDEKLRARLRGWLPAVGYHEVVTSTFMSRQQLDSLQLAEGDVRAQCLAVLNPNHGGETLLRTSMVPGLVDVARRNLNAGVAAPVRLFHQGRVFWPAGEKRQGKHELEGRLPQEPWLLQACVAGLATRSVGGLPADVMELKGLVEQMAGLLRTILTLEPADTEPFLQPGLQWVIRDSGGQAVGWLGRLATAAAAALDMDHPLAVVELDLGRADLLSQAVSYQPFSRFPAVKRDLSLLVPSAVTYGQLAACVEAAGGELLTQVELFDIYAGKGVPEGLSAYGIRLKFQSAKGSLKGATVDRAIAAILGALSEQLQVQQRTA